MSLPSPVWTERIFLECDLEGDAVTAGYQKQIVIHNFHHSVRLPVVTDRRKGGVTIGTSEPGPVTITKIVDRSSPYFFQAACLGRNLGRFVFRFVRDAGSRQEYKVLTLTSVLVQQYDDLGIDADFAMPMERLTLAYETVALRVARQSPVDGSVEGMVEAGFDFTVGRTI
jgi:type VI secretion system Hcp family effector